MLARSRLRQRPCAAYSGGGLTTLRSFAAPLRWWVWLVNTLPLPLRQVRMTRPIAACDAEEGRTFASQRCRAGNPPTFRENPVPRLHGLDACSRLELPRGGGA